MCACDINPQPEVPSDEDDGTGGEAGTLNNPPSQRTDDDVDDYDDLDPSANFANKNDEAPDAAPEDQRDAMPPPFDFREDAGVPGVVN